jgi:hypothetical protein
LATGAIRGTFQIGQPKAGCAYFETTSISVMPQLKRGNFNFERADASQETMTATRKRIVVETATKEGCRLSMEMGGVSGSDNANARKRAAINSNTPKRYCVAGGGGSANAMTNANSGSNATTRMVTVQREPVSNQSENNIRNTRYQQFGDNVPMAINTMAASEDVSSQTTGTSKLTANETWRFLESAGTWDDESIKLTLSTYVKQKMFPHLKFIQGKSMTGYSVDQRSVCGQILSRLNVPRVWGEKFWEHYGRKVECYLNSKRNDTATALKNAFFSKYSNAGCRCMDSLARGSNKS